MYDKDQEMLDYIDEVIVNGRTSDAADDSAGAAWAAYQRGEYSVPDWYSKEWRSRKTRIVEKNIYKRDTSINLDTFLRSMGILFLVIIAIIILITVFS